MEELDKNLKALDQSHEIVPQFYHIGDELTKYIITYIMFKLGFIAGKTLIICENIEQMYKLYMFLDRIGVRQF